MNLYLKGTKILLASFINSARLVVTGRADFWDINKNLGGSDMLKILKEARYFLKLYKSSRSNSRKNVLVQITLNYVTTFITEEQFYYDHRCVR